MNMKHLLLTAVVLTMAATAHAQLETESENPTGYIGNSWPELFYTIDGVLLWNRTLVRFPVEDSRTEYVIPNGVERISNGAFRGCKNLRKIVIPKTMVYIGETAFDGSGIEIFSCTDNDEFTSIDVRERDVEGRSEQARYNMQGMKIQQPQPGVNIIVNSDHTSQKVLER